MADATENYKGYELNVPRLEASTKGHREVRVFKKLIDKDENLQTQITAETTARIGADENLQTQITAETTARIGGDASLTGQLNAIGVRVGTLEQLGHYVGSFATFAALPANVSYFGTGITINDFTTIRNDETHGGNSSRYVVSAINAATGAITWTYDLTYSADISGKQDKLTAGTNITISGSTISATNTVPNNATITLQKNAADVGSFTVDASANKTINFAINEATTYTRIFTITNLRNAYDLNNTTFSSQSPESSPQQFRHYCLGYINPAINIGGNGDGFLKSGVDFSQYGFTWENIASMTAILDLGYSRIQVPSGLAINPKGQHEIFNAKIFILPEVTFMGVMLELAGGYVIPNIARVAVTLTRSA